MKKLTKETKIWTAVLMVGIVVIVLIQLVQSVWPVLQSEKAEVIGVFIGSLFLGSGVGIAVGILLPAFCYRLIVNLVSAEAEFSYGVSVFYTTLLSFVIHVINLGLNLIFGLETLRAYSQPIQVASILLMVASYCGLLVYNKTIPVKQALMSGVLIVTIHVLIYFGLQSL